MRQTTIKHRPAPLVIRKIGWIIGGVFLAVLLAFIFGYFVMLLWNWIMPQLFGLPEIDYWLAFGIIILSRLIFGGFGHGHKDSSKKDHYHRYYGSKYKNKFKPSNCYGSKWAHYETYWEDEGEKSFNEYVSRKQSVDKTVESEETENPTV